MEVVQLTHDGRCKWLETQVLNKVFPEAAQSAKNSNEPTRYMILDWISNDNGKVGVDLKWFKKLGVPAVQTFNDLPKGDNFIVVNTGYDSIIQEEKVLLDRGIRMIDKPCPFVRKLRREFEKVDDAYQYVLLCEPNHIIIKNYATLFPKDMILVQMGNYKERILKEHNGKPIMFISYVTFLKKHSNMIFSFIEKSFPDKEHKMINTQCMWADGKISPLDEIMNLSAEKLEGIKYALLIGSPGSTNKSLMSLYETIIDKGLEVINIGSLKDFLNFRKSHKKEKILLVKSPIPNQAEKPILAFLRRGYLYAYYTLWKERVLQ